MKTMQTILNEYGGFRREDDEIELDNEDEFEFDLNKDDGSDMDDDHHNDEFDNDEFDSDDGLSVDDDDDDDDDGEFDPNEFDDDEGEQDIESRLDDLEDKLNMVLSKFAEVIAKDMVDEPEDDEMDMDMDSDDEMDMDMDADNGEEPDMKADDEAEMEGGEFIDYDDYPSYDDDEFGGEHDMEPHQSDRYDPQIRRRIEDKLERLRMKRELGIEGLNISEEILDEDLSAIMKAKPFKEAQKALDFIGRMWQDDAGRAKKAAAAYMEKNPQAMPGAVKTALKLLLRYKDSVKALNVLKQQYNNAIMGS